MPTTEDLQGNIEYCFVPIHKVFVLSAYFKVLTTKHGLMASAGARAYNGGLGAKPPAGSRGRAPGQGVTPEAESLLAFQRPMTAAKFIPLTVCGNFSLSGCL